MKEKCKKNGDAAGPLGNFVLWLVTERNTEKKRKRNKEKRKKTLNFGSALILTIIVRTLFFSMWLLNFPYRLKKKTYKG